MISGKQRAYLRAMANKLDPIFQIGKGGIGEEMAKSISDALEAKEIIKISVLDTSPDTPREAADVLSKYLACEVVSVIGKKIVLYRESREKKRIVLP